MPITHIELGSMTRRSCLAVVLLLLVSLGCGGKKQKVTYHDANMDFGLVQSVAVMPFDNLSPTGQAGQRTRDVFMTMLQATGAMYVIPSGEVERGIGRSAIDQPAEPTPENVVELARIVSADAIITGTLREYGQVRSGTNTGNVISLSLQMMEAETGKIVWSASSTKGGISAGSRLVGSGGKPMDLVTQEAVDDLLDKLFSP